MFGWGWGRSLLLLLGALVLATYLGLLSSGRIEEAIRWLAARSGTGGAFREPGAGRLEGLFVIISFLLLTPIAALGALFLLVFVVMFLAGTLGPIARVLGMPKWLFMGLLVAGLGGVAYAKSEAWWPWLLWVSGVVAQAFLSVTQ